MLPAGCPGTCRVPDVNGGGGGKAVGGANILGWCGCAGGWRVGVKVCSGLWLGKERGNGEAEGWWDMCGGGAWVLAGVLLLLLLLTKRKAIKHCTEERKALKVHIHYPNELCMAHDKPVTNRSNTLQIQVTILFFYQYHRDTPFSNLSLIFYCLWSLHTKAPRHVSLPLTGWDSVLNNTAAAHKGLISSVHSLLNYRVLSTWLLLIHVFRQMKLNISDRCINKSLISLLWLRKMEECGKREMKLGRQQQIHAYYSVSDSPYPHNIKTEDESAK